MSVEGKTHSEVVAVIKAGGNVTRLLVVDPDTDAFFKRCRVAPTSDHVTGERTHRPDDFRTHKLLFNHSCMAGTE